GVGANLPAGRARDRLDEGDRGTLAVGAGNSDDLPRGAIDTEAGRHRADPLQSHVDGLRLQLLDPLEPLGQIHCKRPKQKRGMRMIRAYSARCTASPNKGVWWLQSFRRTTSR